MITQLLKPITRYLACRKLEKITRERRESFECEQYRRNRAAQRKRWRAREERVAQRIAELHARWDRFERMREERVG